MAKTKGLVIKERTVGESDRLVTLLTADYGLVNAFVRNAKQLKNKLSASTSLFAYCEFSIYQGRDANVVDNATVIEMFLIYEVILKSWRWHSILHSLHMNLQ